MAATADRNWELAAALWQDLYSRSPSTSPVTVYVKCSTAYRQTGRLKEAEDIITKGLHAFPGDNAMLMEWAEIPFAGQLWNEASFRWRQLLDTLQHKAPPHAYVRLTQSYRHLGCHGEAEIVASNGLTLHPNAKRLTIEHAETAAGRQDWQEAINRWASILGRFDPATDAIATKRIERCKARLKPVGDIYYGSRASNYVQQRESTEIWQTEQRVVADIVRELPPGQVVLDVPFGTGRFVRLYHENEMEVYGVEISPKMLEAARADLGDSHYQRCILHTGSAESLTFPNHFFDLVVCFRFLQGIISFGMARRVLEELRRVTKSNGIVVAELHTRNATAPLEKPLGDDVPMGSRFSRAELESFLCGIGFEIFAEKSIKSAIDTQSDAYLLRPASPK